jgi:hypothetical protein
MSTQQTYSYERFFRPVTQVIVIASLGLLLMLVARGFKSMDAEGFDNQLFWVIAGMMLLLYAIFNSVISLTSKNTNQYWTLSIGLYFGLMLVISLFAGFFSGISIGNTGSFPWIFQVLTFGYLLFLCIIRFMRKIVHLAQQEDNRWMNRMK